MDPEKKVKKEFKVQVFENEVTIEPGDGKHNSTIIWLHHIYRNAADLSTYFLKGPALELENAKIVLPQAPSRVITADANKNPTPSWFDVLSRGFNKPHEEVVSVKDLKESTAELEKIIEREVKLLNGDSKKVFLAGFSQGSAIALTAGLGSKEKLGGIFAVHGYFLSLSEINEANKDTPVLVLLGKKPPFRPWDKPDGFYPMFEKTFDELKSKKSTNTTVEVVEQDVYYDQEFIQKKLVEFVNSRLAA